jgi:GPH family glycoside/pentoside/hexuronide:cation symporter
MGVVLASMLADICDEDEYKFNVRREGIFVGVQKWAFFICFSVSGITSGLTLNLIDFDANLGSSQPESTILWMRLLLCGGTMLSALLGYLIIGKYSLSKEKCEEMSKHIKQKNNNSTVTT